MLDVFKSQTCKEPPCLACSAPCAFANSFQMHVMSSSCKFVHCVCHHPEIFLFPVCGLVALWLMHSCFYREIRYHLCWGPHPWDLYSWKELQARQQLPVALQAVITPWWHEQEDHTLCGGRRCWQQGGPDQQNDQEDELSLWWVEGKFLAGLRSTPSSLDVVNDAYSFFPILSTMVKSCWL